jgi:small subunit ribosomal protein S21
LITIINVTRGEVKAPTDERAIEQSSFNSWFVCVTQVMKVERREGETVEQLLRRFNKGVVAERITKTYREKMHFVSKSEQAKEKRRRAERNRRKKAMQTH